ncbi:MAG: hypothetical protein EWV41_00610 [Microcystis wesenbergii Mw_MB_S_20031200_S109]|nr:MAG: hypothetical protein EWV41_00610 [Microcystis wesenbergii Mw_MB_S_20031200_S109]
MGSMSLVHWLIVFSFIFLVIYPGAKVLKKMGYSGWWAIGLIVPLGFIVGLWVLASSKWPIEQQRGSEE